LTLKEDRLRLDTKKKIFTLRAVKHWRRLPRKAVDAPSLWSFRVRLDGVLDSLSWWGAALRIHSFGSGWV